MTGVEGYVESCASGFLAGVELARRLYGRAPQAELISVHGFDFDFGEELSPQTAQAAQTVIDGLWLRLRPDLISEE